ncbi:MAG: caa(3)-type oxidase subunit IV [Candidatus Latescibacteria bacterium]|nr:caa(3)-type oxidase subunit IV [Candidatus Latescibacterota bacterium]
MSEHHIVPLKTYFLIFTALMVGTVLTVVAAFVDLGLINTPLALIIALSKASLVILVFMHVKYSQKLVWVTAVAGFLWLGIMLAFTFQDYVSRDWQQAPPIEFLEEAAGSTSF